jgi:phosphoserine aminotransferase
MTTIAAGATTKTSATKPDRIFNFSAGPGVLPEPVLRQAQQDLWNIMGSGVGILEHSHRGPVFDRVLAEAEADCRELAGIPSNYRVMFVQGGASSQFFMVPMNFLKSKSSVADYFVTGKWAADAAKEAKAFGTINIAATSAETNHDRIPDKSTWKFSKDAVYCHYCSNNTIFGTEWQSVPSHPHGAPIVCDASSDIFSGPIDVTKYAMLYAGAQKNLGPAGTVLVIARDDFIAQSREDIPTMLSYRTHAENDSRYNTPPTFGIYLIGQTFKWIKANGGLAGMARRNKEKADLLYGQLDASGFYKRHAQPNSRSIMNVTFRCPTEELDKKFVKEAEARGLDGLKGHRATGGMRASIYNAFPVEGVRALVAFMKDFEARNG